MNVRAAQDLLARHIRDQGLKHTKQREVVLDAFMAGEGHVSIDDVLRRAQGQSPGLGYATVYRAMKLFVDAGIALERHFQDGQTRYEPVDPDEHHDHLICTACGNIFEFEDPIIEERQREVARTHGFRASHHRHEIYGTCDDPSTCTRRPA